MAVVPKQSGIDVLRKLVPLNTLSDEALEQLFGTARFDKLQKGDILFEEGDTEAQRIYLLSGKISLTEKGQQAYLLSGGDNMSRYPLAHNIPRKYTATAKTKAEVVTLDNQMLGDLIAKANRSSYEVEEVDSELNDDWMSQLLASPVFQQIPAANLQQVMMKMEEVTMVAGEMVIQEGDEGDFFYLMNSGSALVSCASPGGGIKELARLGAGATFGEHSLISGSPRSSSVTMLTDGVLLRLDKESFVEFVKQPLSAVITYEEAAEKVNQGAQWLDVRSEKEREKSLIPGSISIPFNALRQRLSGLDKNKDYIVYCQDGMVSATAVYLLVDAGFAALVLSGGLHSVPADALQGSEPDDGARVIDLHPKPEETAVTEPSVEEVPDEEAELLRRRLQLTEQQAKQQILQARKMKLLIDKLKSNLATVEAEKDESIAQHAEEREQFKALEKKLKELEAASQADQEQITQAEKYKKDSEDAWIAVEEAKADMTASRLEAEKALRAGEDKVQALKADLAEAENRSSQQLADMQKERDELRQALEQEKSQNSSRQSSLDTAADELAQLKDKLMAAEAAAEQAEQAANEDRVEAESKQKQLAEDVSRLTRDLEAATRQAEEAANEGRRETEAKQKQLAEEVERLAQALEVAQSELRSQSETGNQVVALQGQLEEAEVQQQSAQAELESKQVYIAEVERRNQAQLEALNDERDKAAALSKEINELQRLREQQDQALAELQNQQQEKLQAQESLEQLTNERDALQLRADEQKQQIEALEEQLDNSQADNAQSKHLNGELEALKSDLQQAQSDRDQLTREVDDQSAQLADLEQQLEGANAQVEGIEDQDLLKQELDELREKLEASESALKIATENGAGQQDDKQIRVLQAELETLTQALDDADQTHDALKEQFNALEQQLAEQQGSSEADDAPQETISQLESQVASLEQELGLHKEQADKDVEALRSQLSETEEKLKAAERAQGLSGSDQMEALKAQLAEAEQKAKERELSGSADAAENEVLRQDIDSLRKSLEERRQELENSYKESALLEERIEERNTEVDRINAALEMAQSDLDRAKAESREAIESREELEKAVEVLQKQVIRSNSETDLVDTRIGTAALDIEPEQSRVKALMVPAVAALVAFVAADMLAISSGKGELISGLFGDDSSEVHQPAERVAIIEQPPAAVANKTDPKAKSQQPTTAPPIAKRAAEPASTPAVSPAPTPEITETEKTEIVAPVPAEEVVAEVPKPSQPDVEPSVESKSTEPENGTEIQDRLRSGSLAPPMVYIRGATFTMGSDRNQLASEERPAHPVTVPSYAIGRYEVTFREYAKFAAATGRSVPSDLGWGEGQRPVINVTWEDANSYAEWLSEQTGESYRLPTEAEWEYAAGAGNQSLYWWGFDPGQNNANCFNCGSRWDRLSTAPVGSFDANKFGLHNTAGNVMEWVHDCYHDNYKGAPGDGSAWVDPGCRERVVKGGAFNKPNTALRTTRRGHHDSDAKLFVVGFRLAREVD